MNKRVLIIKENHNSFEQYYTTSLKEYANVVPYKETGKRGYVIRALCKRSGMHFLVKAWLGS